jgi:5' nucleotidase, deoxy (Pyrimidine), cytosolic type C protein (NT5C)
MPLHPGAREMMERLSLRHHVVVITARPENARDATEAWLRNNELQYHELAIATERRRACTRRILVDDYAGNVTEYLTNTCGTAVLVDQPWNQDREGLHEWAGTPRLLERLSLSSKFHLWSRAATDLDVREAVSLQVHAAVRAATARPHPAAHRAGLVSQHATGAPVGIVVERATATVPSACTMSEGSTSTWVARYRRDATGERVADRFPHAFQNEVCLCQGSFLRRWGALDARHPPAALMVVPAG